MLSVYIYIYNIGIRVYLIYAYRTMGVIIKVQEIFKNPL